MIDGDRDPDPDAARRLAEASTDADANSFDPHATRAPESDDPFATRAEATLPNWPGPSGEESTPGRVPPGASRFRVLRPHARGGLGEVFVALDEELRREVALKEIRERHADDPRSRARFLLEAEVTGSLEHPGIIPVYGLGHHPDGRPYYAMRLIRGGSLKEAGDRHHRADGPRPDHAERTLRFRTLLGKFVDICNAVAYAHSRDVLHRDLKPANVMLGPYGETLVVDWGLAKSTARPCADDPRDDAPPPISGESSATVAGSVIGTPAFMSPEQAAGDLDRLGPASDIYSLGATLYYVLTGRPPFEGDDIDETLAKVREGAFPPPRKARKDVPRALQAIALKAMATRPEGRYPTARALAADVEHWMAGAPVSAYPDRIGCQVRRWCRRHPVLATSAFSCLFLDLCFVVISLLAYFQSVLHAGMMPRLNMAAGVLALIPFAGQVGALIGSAAGAVVGGALKRSRAGLVRGAGVGLNVGIPAAVVVYLGLGVFGVAKAPSLTALFLPAASPTASPPEDWPRLPGAVSGPPDRSEPGAPFDVAAFFDDPPPEENAAPLYLDALLEFDDEMAACFSPAEGARRGPIARDRAGRARAVLDLGALDTLLEEYEVGFLKLKQARRRPLCVFRAGLGIEARPPHLQAARKVAEVAVLLARRRLERGEVDRAIDDLEAVLGLARDLRPRGAFLAQMVAVSVEATGEEEILLPILRRPDLRPEQADRLLAILDAQGSRPFDPFAEAVRAEYLGTGRVIRDFVDRVTSEETPGGSRARDALRPLLAARPSRERPRLEALEASLDAQLSRTTPEDFALSSRRASDEYHRAILELGGLPLPGRIAAADRLPARVLGGHPLLLHVTPSGGDLLKALGRAEARRQAMKCLVALRRWDLDGRGEPADLEEVVRAAGMAKVPTDPFRVDGGPLRMITAEGGPVVYSAGPDGVDDRYRLKPVVDAR